MQNKTLIVTEKPSVAGDIAKVLAKRHGKFKQDKNGIYENEEYVIAFAVGHLLEMNSPEELEVKRGKWKLENLPVKPSHQQFVLQPFEKTKSIIRVLAKQYARTDVDKVVNACDAGREGELIFYNLMSYLQAAPRSKNKHNNLAPGHKPFYRLWLQSMTEDAINHSFDKLQQHEDYKNLADAAVCRAQADWLVGVNGTRAMTAMISNPGTFQLTTVGRVQTPTLAILVARELEIAAFVSQPFFEIVADFAHTQGTVQAKWFDQKFFEEGGKKADRIFSTETKDQIVKQLTANKEPITFVDKETKKKVSAPPLFDLTSLQREANSRFGFSARGSLGIAQRLYERHKLITYPRTDSKYLPEDYQATLRKVMENQISNNDIGATYAKYVLDNRLIEKVKKFVFDSQKVSDHFAIVPTGVAPKKLNEQEEKIYRLIVQRTIARFYPQAEYLQTERSYFVGDNAFRTRGIKVIAQGWWQVAQKQTEERELPLSEGQEQIGIENIEALEKATAPPARYDEGKLLSAMEGAGKLIEDEEMKSLLKGKGLGTPATRASIIEGLLREKYVIRDGKLLFATTYALELIRLLRDELKIDALTKPELTGQWEMRLAEVENGQLGADAFMNDIDDMVDKMVDSVTKNKNYKPSEQEIEEMDSMGTCPSCAKGSMYKSTVKYMCTQCDYFLWANIARRPLSDAEATALLSGEQIGPFDNFLSRFGKEFSAEIKLDEQYKPGFIFASDAPIDAAQLESAEVVGACPLCKAEVLHVDKAYICKQRVEKKCEFRIGNSILSRELSVAEIQALLSEGKTPLLEGFISKKTNKPFSAFLLLEEGGKLKFEFPPREAKKKATKSSRSRTNAST